MALKDAKSYITLTAMRDHRKKWRIVRKQADTQTKSWREEVI